MYSNRRALVIGIDNYKHLDSLPLALNDALRIYDTLSTYQCRFSVTLAGSEVTRLDIRKKFRELFEGADDDAVIVFYYAGHGNTVDGATYLITVGDAERENTEGFEFEALLQIVREKRKPNQSIIFILDCCHAGALNIDTNNLERNHAGSSTVLLAATEYNQNSYETSKYENGVFTHWICQGLLGSAANNEGIVTPNSLYDYVSSAMQSTGEKQIPVYKTAVIGSNVHLSRGHNPIENSKTDGLNSIILNNIKDETTRAIDRARELLSSWPIKAKEIQEIISNLINWHEMLKGRYFSLGNNKDFKSLEEDILYMSAQIASRLSTGVETHLGKIVRKIGEGGFGIVYEVMGYDNKSYAYKVYHANQLHDKAKVKAFKRGYNAMKILKDHPRIVDVHNLTLAPLGFYMDFIDGTNLADWWHENDLSTMLNVLIQIAQTLDFSHNHERKIIHRDIKPENILILKNDADKEITSYLTDYDLSWYSMSTTYSAIGSSAVFGHYLYAAPEQINSPDDENNRRITTDIYSFGQLCYFVIQGRHPDSLSEHSKASLKERLKQWNSNEVAIKFMKFYEKSTQRTPSKRFQNMKEIVDTLAEIKGLISDPDLSKELPLDEFMKEINFLFNGITNIAKQEFLSVSGRTNISITSINKQRISILFENTSGNLGMTGSYEAQINSINRKVDEALSNNYKSVKRKNEKERRSLYSCLVEIEGNNITLMGAQLVKKAIDSVVKAIEG